jgi:hypothetical protein
MCRNFFAIHSWNARAERFRLDESKDGVCCEVLVLEVVFIALTGLVKGSGVEHSVFLAEVKLFKVSRGSKRRSLEPLGLSR